MSKAKNHHKQRMVSNYICIYGGLYGHGPDFHIMIQAIHIHAARNSSFHNRINNLIAEGNFPEILGRAWKHHASQYV